MDAVSKIERMAMYLELALSSCGADCGYDDCVQVARQIEASEDRRAARDLVVDRFDVGPARAEILLKGLAPILGEPTN